MVARKVSARLKPNSLARFSTLMECEILPWLREQEGFLDLVTLAAPDGQEVATISFWDRPANAQACNATAYPESLKVLAELLDGAPYVKTFDVIRSTLHRLPSQRLHQAEDLIQRSPSAELDYGATETGF